jgi:hypothetical protein
MNNQLQTFQQFFNKLQNGALPILQLMRVKDGVATLCDLETTVDFPLNFPDGYYDLKMNEPFWIKALDDDYPAQAVDFSVVPPMASATLTGSLIIRYAAFVDNDKEHPQMNGIYVSPAWIAASNRRILRYEASDPAAVGKDFEVIIPPVMPLLARCKENPHIPVKVGLYAVGKAKNIRFEFPDCQITIRAIEGKYPNFRGAIPVWDTVKLRCFTMPVETLKQLGKTVSSFEVPCVKLSPSGMMIENAEKKLDKSWPVPEECPRPLTEPAGINMPVIIGDGKAEDVLGFDPNQLLSFVPAQFKDMVTIGWHAPGRPLAVWLDTAEAVDLRKNPLPEILKPPRVFANIEEAKQALFDALDIAWGIKPATPAPAAETPAETLVETHGGASDSAEISAEFSSTGTHGNGSPARTRRAKAA